MAFTTRDGKTQTVLSEINMVPFIDVVLVLLIIFMITAPVLQSGIEVDVPKTQTVVTELADDLLIVTIDQKEELYLLGKPVHVDDLAAKVKELAPAHKDSGVYVQSDRRVTVETFTNVLERLKRGGIEKITIVTEPLGTPARK